MKKSFNWGWPVFCCVLLAAAAGGVWYLYQEENVTAPVALGELTWSSHPAPIEEDVGRARLEVPAMATEDDVEESFDWPEGAVPRELVMNFESRGEMEEFIREARRAGLEVDVLGALQLVRVRASDDGQLRRAAALGANAEVSLNPYVAAPDLPPMEGIPEHFQPFGDLALAWMGVPDDNEDWGRGVRVAVLDTGVNDHPTLANASITHMSVLGNEGRLVDKGTHGTAVASVIVGQGDVRGIAPAAEILSIQVLDGKGVGNGFDLARGIIEAVDNDAQIINLSLGTETPSSALQSATKYAQDRDVLVLASAGNDGGGQIMFPAAYEGVIAVGSVDGRGQQMPFSNRGPNMGVAAPGFGVKTAGPDGGSTYTNGTSISAPWVTGALTALLPEMSPQEAVDVVMNHANDAGPPGHDGYYGNGILDMERVALRDQPGIYDIAVADHYLHRGESGPEVMVTVENRGTEAVGNISLEVMVNGELRTVPIGSLSAGEVGAGSISLGELSRTSYSAEIISRVVSPGLVDARPDNDIKGSTISLAPPK